MTRRTRPESELTPFGRWLLDQLEQRSITRAELARMVNSGSGNVSDWLYASVPTPGRCTAIATALMLPVEDVLIQAGHLEPMVTPDTAIHREAMSLLARIPGPLLVTVIPMLRGLVEHAAVTLDEQTKAMDRE